MDNNRLIPLLSHIITTNFGCARRSLVPTFPPLEVRRQSTSHLLQYRSASSPRSCALRFQETCRGLSKSHYPKGGGAAQRRPEHVNGRVEHLPSMPATRQNSRSGREDEWGQTRPAGQHQRVFDGSVPNVSKPVTDSCVLSQSPGVTVYSRQTTP